MGAGGLAPSFWYAVRYGNYETYHYRRRRPCRQRSGIDACRLGFAVHLVEMRPEKQTCVHKTGLCAELVCSNSLKSMKADSAAGMLKAELAALGSHVFAAAQAHAVAAGGALAVDREAFAREVTDRIAAHPNITLEHAEVCSIEQACKGSDAVVLASGPLTSDALAASLQRLTGVDTWRFTMRRRLSSWRIRLIAANCSAKAATRMPRATRAII